MIRSKNYVGQESKFNLIIILCFSNLPVIVILLPSYGHSSFLNYFCLFFQKTTLNPGNRQTLTYAKTWSMIHRQESFTRSWDAQTITTPTQLLLSREQVPQQGQAEYPAPWTLVRTQSHQRRRQLLQGWRNRSRCTLTTTTTTSMRIHTLPR